MSLVGCSKDYGCLLCTIGVRRWQEVVKVGSYRFFVDRHGLPEFMTDSRTILGTKDVGDIVVDGIKRYESWGSGSWPGGNIKTGNISPTHDSMWVYNVNCRAQLKLKLKLNRKCEPHAPQTVPWRIQSDQPKE
jgi:hypothetical protein